MTWLKRVLDRLGGQSTSGDVVPTNPEQQHTLERAEALLDHPQIKALLARRVVDDYDQAESARRAGR